MTGEEKYKVLNTALTKLGNTIELISPSLFTLHASLIIGVFHGDEPQGKYLIEEYLKKYYNSPSSESEIPVLPQGEDISGSTRLYDIHLRQLSRNLRNNSTKQEIILWQHIKQKQLGYKFRRQQPIGAYIADFVCFEKKLIVELDGSQHNNGKTIEYDRIRDSFFTNSGFRVIRFWNNDVDKNLEGVIEKIKTELKTCPPLEGGPKSCKPAEDAECSHISLNADEAISKRGLLFIPCLNPDGLQLGQRTNANGVDLNRNFPTKNWGQNLGDNATCDDENSGYYGGKSAGSEIETQFLIDTINEFKPEIILTLHAPYKVVNYDGPAKEIADKISKIINYPVESSIGYPTPGSFGTYAGIERQIPVITLELDEECPVEDLIKPVHKIFDLFK